VVGRPWGSLFFVYVLTILKRVEGESVPGSKIADPTEPSAPPPYE